MITVTDSLTLGGAATMAQQQQGSPPPPLQEVGNGLQPMADHADKARDDSKPTVIPQQPVAEAADSKAPPTEQPTKGLTKLEREACLFMLNLLSKYKEADPFRAPVDWEALNIPDYPVVIKQPMDLRTCREKVRANAYNSMEEWQADVALIWSNCRKYNGDQHPVTKMAEKLQAALERRMEEAFAGAKRELAAQQARGEAGQLQPQQLQQQPQQPQQQPQKIVRLKVPRDAALRGSQSAGSDNDSGEDTKPTGIARMPSGTRLVIPGRQLDGRSSDSAAGRQQPSPDSMRLTLKRASSGGSLPEPSAAAAAAAAAGKGNAAAKRKPSGGGSSGGGIAGLDYGSLEQLTNSQAAKQLGVGDADDLAFLAVWKRVISKRQQAATEAESLRNSNKKLKRSATVAEEQAKELLGKLKAETAARAAAEKKLEELQQQHSQLQEQHKQQHQVLEHQRQLLEQQQQVLRQVLKQQQQQQAGAGAAGAPPPPAAPTSAPPAAPAPTLRCEPSPQLQQQPLPLSSLQQQQQQQQPPPSLQQPVIQQQQQQQFLPGSQPLLAQQDSPLLPLEPDDLMQL